MSICAGKSVEEFSSKNALWFFNTEAKVNQQVCLVKTTKDFFSEIEEEEDYSIWDIVALPNAAAKNLFACSSPYAIYICEIEREQKIKLRKKIPMPGLLDLQVSPDGLYLSGITNIGDSKYKRSVFILNTMTGSLECLASGPKYEAQNSWIKNVWVNRVNERLHIINPENLIEYRIKSPVKALQHSVINTTDSSELLAEMPNDQVVSVRFHDAKKMAAELHEVLPENFSKPLHRITLEYVGMFAHPDEPIAPLFLPLTLRKNIHRFVRTHELSAKALPHDLAKAAFVRQLMVYINNLTLEDFKDNNSPIQNWIKQFFMGNPKKKIAKDPVAIARDKKSNEELARLKNDLELETLIKQITAPKVVAGIMVHLKMATQSSRTNQIKLF